VRDFGAEDDVNVFDIDVARIREEIPGRDLSEKVIVKD
jgi:hypothetical protein